MRLIFKQEALQHPIYSIVKLSIYAILQKQKPKLKLQNLLYNANQFRCYYYPLLNLDCKG